MAGSEKRDVELDQREWYSARPFWPIADYDSISIAQDGLEFDTPVYNNSSRINDVFWGL